MKEYREQIRKQSSWDLPESWLWDFSSRRGRSYLGRIKLLFEFIGDLNGKKILDAGCGDGRVSTECAYRSASVVGVDINARALEFARSFSPPSVLYRAASITKLPFADQQFDLVLCIETFEHIPPSQEIIAICEMHRVLKKGGRLILSVPSVLIPLAQRPRHYRHFTPSLIRVLFSPYFAFGAMYGQERVSPLLRVLELVYANRFWRIRLIVWYVNKHLFIRYLNRSPVEKAAHIIYLLHRKDGK